MIRIGAVNIDTSHPLGFAEVMEKGERAKYVGVYNDSFRSDEEVEGFIKRFGLEKRCESLDELADMCDIGFIHGCDWDDHIRCAMPFINKGKPVFVDKPLIGSLADCEKIKALADKGAVILGASSARYAFEIQELMNMPTEQRGEILHVYGTSGVDEFNYGIHIAEAIGAVVDSEAVSVKFCGRALQGENYADTFYISFKNGKGATFTTLTGVWQPFVLTVMTSKTTHNFKMDSSRLYEALMNEICSYMENKPSLLASCDKLLESVKIMLAAKASRELSGKEIKLCSLDGSFSFDGKAFVKSYGDAAGKMYAL